MSSYLLDNGNIYMGIKCLMYWACTVYRCTLHNENIFLFGNEYIIYYSSEKSKRKQTKKKSLREILEKNGGKN